MEILIKDSGKYRDFTIYDVDNCLECTEDMECEIPYDDELGTRFLDTDEEFKQVVDYWVRECVEYLAELENSNGNESVFSGDMWTFKNLEIYIDNNLIISGDID